MKPVACFLKYTVPTRRINARKPELLLVSDSVPGIGCWPPVINDAYCMRYLKKVAFPILLKNDI